MPSSGSGRAGSRRVLPDDVAKHFAKAQLRRRDGTYAAVARHALGPIGYNTKLVKPEDAPKSFADLLDPKWNGQDRQGASRL